MPRIKGSSARAGIHPYLKPDFDWPKLDYSNEGLCHVNDEVFFNKRVEEIRKKRTFYFNEKLCRAFGLNYSQKGQKVVLNKNVVYQIALTHWDKNHLSRWKNLKEETVTLVNDGISWWTAETLWIKVKL